MKKALKSFFNQFKEEFITIPILIVIVELTRRYLMVTFPKMGTFIPEAEVFVFLVKFWQELWVTCLTWLALRIVFYPAFKDFIDTLNFYSSKFDTVQDTRRSFFSLALFLGLFFGFIMLVNGANISIKEPFYNVNQSEVLLRNKLCDTLSKQLYVRELTGHNDGIEVEKYLKSVGAKKGQSWCAAYVSYNLNTYKIKNANSVWSPAFANENYKTKHAQPGDVFTIYYSNLKRVGHVGFVIRVTHGYYQTNEGNTGGQGVREGDGVHSYWRNPQLVYQVSNYITPHFKNQLNSNEKTTVTAGVTSHDYYLVQNKTKSNKKLGDNSGFERHLFNYYFNNIQGQYFTCNWRQFVNPFANEQHRAGIAANCGDWWYEVGSEKCGRKANSELLVQRFRTEGEASGKNNQPVQSYFEPKRENRSYYSKGNEAYSIYSKMGLDWTFDRWICFSDFDRNVTEEVEINFKKYHSW